MAVVGILLRQSTMSTHLKPVLQRSFSSCCTRNTFSQTVHFRSVQHTEELPKRFYSTLITDTNSRFWEKSKFPTGTTYLRGLMIPTACTMCTGTTGVRHIWRCAARQGRAKLPFEVHGDVLSDTTVFSYTNARLYRMMTIFGIVQFFFWGNLALFTYSSFENYGKEGQQYVKDSSSGQIMEMLSHHSYKIAASCVFLGHIVLAFTMIYPFRTVAGLALLRGGTDVKVTTYSHFGKTTSFQVPLDHISCHQSRNASGTQASLKVKDKWMYFLLDKRDGVFHNPQLFDHIVGLKRDLK